MALLMSDMQAGSDAVKQLNQNVIDIADAPEKSRQALEKGRLEQEKSQLDIEIKTMTNTALKEAVQDDKDAQEVFKGFYSDPANKDKTGSESMFEMAKIYAGKDLKKYETLMSKAGKLQEIETKSEENNNKIQKTRLDNISRILPTIDPENPAQVQELIMAGHINGFNTDLYRKEIGQLGPVPAFNNLVGRVKAAQQQKIDLQEAKEARQVEQFNKRLDLDYARLEAQRERDEARERQADKKAEEDKKTGNIKEQTVLQKDKRDYQARYQTLFNKYKIDFAGETGEAATTLTKQFWNDLEGLNKVLGEDIKDRDPTFKLMVNPKIGLSVETGIDIPVANGFVATKDQEESISKAIQAIQQKPEIREQVLARLKSSGIKIRE